MGRVGRDKFGNCDNTINDGCSLYRKKLLSVIARVRVVLKRTVVGD